MKSILHSRFGKLIVLFSNKSMEYDKNKKSDNIWFQQVFINEDNFNLISRFCKIELELIYNSNMISKCCLRSIESIFIYLIFIIRSLIYVDVSYIKF